MASFILLLLSSLVLTTVVSQTQQDLPVTAYWAGFTSDSTGTFLTAAQKKQVTQGTYNGQIYYSQNAGATWELSDAPAQGYYSIAGSSSGAVLVTIGNSEIPYVSIDYGRTWVKKTAPQAYSSAYVAISGNGQCMAYANHNSGISYSDNQGSSWITIGPQNVRCQAVGLDATGVYIVVAVQDVGLYFSDNSGATFKLAYGNTAASFSLVAFSGDATVYVGMKTSPHSILVSENYGALWNATGGTASNMQSIAYLSVSSSGENIFSVWGSDLYFSSNGGASFAQLTDRYSSVCIINGEGDFVLYNYGTTYSSVNSSVYSADPSKIMFAFIYYNTTNLISFPCIRYSRLNALNEAYKRPFRQ